ncbi:MAG: hypothetical protein P8J61_09965 [Gammaproteobacteria bacterium]|jgi:hypothetical protein|nr:hypothetical protein [Gammaproteobacteria bacterium]
MVKHRSYQHFYLLGLVYLIFFYFPAWAQNEPENFLIENESATEQNEVFLQTSVNKNQVYVQEALIYSIKLYYTLAFERGASFSRLEMSEAAFNKLGDDLNYTETIDGVLYTVNESRFIIFPQRSGEFSIAPMRFRAFTQTRATRNNNNLQTTAQRQTIELISQEHKISVVTLPRSYPSLNWLPSSNVTISDSWSRSLQDMRIGDSVVRTIQLDAKDIYASMLINLDFTSASKLRNYPAEAQQVDITENSGVRSGHTQNVTIVATEVGKFTLPAIEIPWWNTETNTLEYATLPAQEFDILTVDGQSVEAEIGLQNIGSTSGSFWSSINLNLLLFIGVLVLISALFFGPVLLLLWHKLKKYIYKLIRKENNKTEQKIPNINKSLQALKRACEQQDINATAESFLSWGQAYFQNLALYNIKKLAEKFNQNSLNSLLKNLQECLYAENSDKNFEFDSLLEEVIILHKDRKANLDKNLPFSLPPLYKN